MEEEDVVVVDIGSASTKVGFAGEDIPRVICPSTLNDFEENRVRRIECLEFNEDASSHAMRNHVVQRGMVPNYEGAVDNYITLLEQIYERDLNVTPDTMPILLTEPPQQNQDTRELIAEHLFEALKVPALSICSTAVLSLFASGRTKGLVAEAGAGALSVVPVFEGFALHHAALRAPVGGQDATRRLHRALALRARGGGGGGGGGGRGGAEIQFDTARDIKEKLGSVAERRPPAGGGGGSGGGWEAAALQYELPDGATVDVPPALLRDAGELLFSPEAGGGEGEGAVAAACPDGGLAAMAARSLALCDEAASRELRGAVVLAGGATMAAGFQARMQSELEERLLRSGGGGDPGAGAPPRVVPSAAGHEPGYSAQRRHAAWVGGSMFASLPTFEMVRVTKQEWEDNGEKSVVHKKAL